MSDVSVAVLSDRGGLCTGILLGHGSHLVLVDCGDGIARDLADRGVAVDALDAVVITHDHGDHVGGLFGLLWWLKVAGRAADLPLYTPAAAPTVDALLQAFPVRLPFRIHRHTLAHDAPVEAGPFRLTTFPVRHRRSSSSTDLMEVHGLRFEAGGQRVVVSSDTGPCERLEQEVTGADVVLIEATWPDGRAVVADTHLTASQSAAIGARARRYVPYHRASACIGTGRTD